MIIETMPATTSTDPRVEKLRKIASEPTPHHEIRWRPGRGNGQYPYTDTDYVIRTLNDIFDFDWTFVVEHEELVHFRDIPFEIKVRGRLIVPINDRKITKMQYGAATIEYNKDGKPVMIADAYKSAASDSLKKCASELGIAHDIYDTDSPLHRGQRNGQQRQSEQQSNNNQSNGQAPLASVKPITSEQINRINLLWPVLGPDRDGQKIALNDAIKQYNKVDDVARLDTEAAAKWIAWLENRQAEAQRKAKEQLPTEPVAAAKVYESPLQLAEVEAALYQIWCDMGKPAGDFLDYRRANLVGKSEAELRAILEKWQAVLLDRQQKQTPQPVPAPQQDKGSGLDQWKCTQETGSRQLAMDVLNATARLEKSGVTEQQWRVELDAMFPKYGALISRKNLTEDECRQWVELCNQWAAKREQQAAKSAQATQAA
jgi:hypothetical protein